jgi:hypothetical protein
VVVPASLRARSIQNAFRDGGVADGVSASAVRLSKAASSGYVTCTVQITRFADERLTRLALLSYPGGGVVRSPKERHMK